MSLKEFWLEFHNEILITSLFAVFCIGLLIYLSIVQARENKKIKSIIISLTIMLAILFGLTYTMIKGEFKYLNIIIIDTIIIVAYSLFSFILFRDQKNKEENEKTTKKIATLGIIIGLSTVLMFLSIPIFPPLPFLRLELSGLIIFMVLMWFDFRSAIVVSLLTNVIHAMMQLTPAKIPFLDEGVNFIATMVFIAPSAILISNFRKGNVPSKRQVITSTIIGVVSTTIFMTLYNAFINLPIIFKIPMSFIDVVKIFTTFNILKWGCVALVINLTWVRLYDLRQSIL